MLPSFEQFDKIPRLSREIVVTEKVLCKVLGVQFEIIEYDHHK